jgi:hypothetical protein
MVSPSLRRVRRARPHSKSRKGLMEAFSPLRARDVPRAKRGLPFVAPLSLLHDSKLSHVTNFPIPPLHSPDAYTPYAAPSHVAWSHKAGVSQAGWSS